MSKRRKKRIRQKFKETVRRASEDGVLRKGEGINRAYQAALKAGINPDNLKNRLESITGRKGVKVKRGVKNIFGIDPKGDGGGGKPKKPDFFEETRTIEPSNEYSEPTKSWKPGKIEKRVANKWQKIRDRYKGPKRLDIKDRSTGRMKRFRKPTGGFDRKAYLAKVKSDTLSRYQELGGERKGKRFLGKEAPTPNLDKIPRKFGRSLDTVRSSLESIKKPTGNKLAKSVGMELTSGYTPKTDYGKSGLQLIGGSGRNTSSGPRRRKDMRTHARINR
tara:strand:+ start:1853 stop:2680 length:828 start_codon:yes stop_codon:yes gene_type:complete